MTRKQTLALTAVIISSGVVFLDGTIVNLALPKIAAEFGAGFASQQWIVDAYLLSLSALILLGGSLGDIFGRKRTYLLGLGGFAITSLLCGIMPNAVALITMRILQGAFGALLIPGALAIINTNFAADLRGKAFGRWTAWSAITTAIGPVVGGYIIDHFSWRWIFVINVPLIAIVLLLALPSIVESKDSRPRKLDLTGALLAILGLGGTVYGLIEGPGRHWDSGVLAILIAGIAFIATFLWNQSHKSDPMLPLELFKSRNFTGVNLATFAMYGGLSGFFFLLILHLQSVVGLSSQAAGGTLIPITVILMLLSSRIGALAGKHGPRLFMTVGPILAGLGIAYLLPLHAGSSYLLEILPGVILFGLGLAITVAPLTTAVMASVDESHSGIASGVNNAVSRVAGLIVVAVVGIFGAGSAYHFGVLLSAGLAIAAGIISWLLVRNPNKPATD